MWLGMLTLAGGNVMSTAFLKRAFITAQITPRYENKLNVLIENCLLKNKYIVAKCVGSTFWSSSVIK